MKNKHPLLIYRALGKQISKLILLFSLFVVALYLVNSYIYQLFTWSEGALILFIVAITLVWAFVFYRYYQAAVIIKKNHLLIRAPWYRKKIPYNDIKGVIPTRISERFTAEGINASELNWLKELYKKPGALVQTRQTVQLTEGGIGLHRLFIPPLPDHGVILILTDWVAFANTAEKARNIWQEQQQSSPKPNATNTADLDPALSEEESDKPRQPLGEKPLILIITADSEQQDRLENLLNTAYRLAFAKSGVKGLRIARDKQPSLILSDVKLPNMSGLQTLKAIRKSERIQNIPIILLSEKNRDDVAIEALQNGGNDFITLPFNGDVLLARIRLWLNQATELKTLKSINSTLHGKTLNQMAELVRRGELINFLPQTVAQSVMSGEIDSKTRPLQRLNATVLFIDIVGFTTLTAQLDPQVLSEILNEYLREMTAAAIKFNGTVDKYIGDAVMVLFGAPDTQDEATQVWNATQTAFLMLQRVEEMSMIWRSRLPRDLEVRIGFNIGECTAGVFGNDLLKSYTVVGRAVNIAARLQSAAEPGQIICSTESLRYIQGKVLSRPLGNLKLKGVPHPVDACCLEQLITPDQIRREAEGLS